MIEKPALVQRAAKWTRIALLALIATVLGLIVTTPRNEYPLTMSHAQANAIAAAPGFLLTSLGASNNDRFYLVDTTKQIICVYTDNGEKLRLEAARKFDVDSDIVDGSVPLKNIRIEQPNGISREDAKIYSDELKAQLEKLQGRKGKK